MRQHQWKEERFVANSNLNGINCSIQHWSCALCHAPFNHEGLPEGVRPENHGSCRGHNMQKIKREKPLDLQKFEDDDVYQPRPKKGGRRNGRR